MSSQPVDLGDPRVLARRIELAQADQNRAFVDAIGQSAPGSQASSLVIKGGWSNFAGPNSPLSQAQALGFDQPYEAADLEAIERHLGAGGGEVRIELTPYADPSLADLLAGQGYRLQEFHQVLAMRLPEDQGDHVLEANSRIAVRKAAPHERSLWSRIVMMGFLESDQIDEAAADLMMPRIAVSGTAYFLAFFEGEAAGGGAIGLCEGVATLSGTGVRVAYRRRGLQTALIRARLDFAREHGCDLASSSTLPATASQRNLERCGFRVAYPKVVMVKQKTRAATL